MNRPTQKSQKFRYEGIYFIVQAFCGESEIEYDTYQKAYEKNTNKNIFVVSTSDERFSWEYCTLFGDMPCSGLNKNELIEVDRKIQAYCSEQGLDLVGYTFKEDYIYLEVQTANHFPDTYSTELSWEDFNKL